MFSRLQFVSTAMLTSLAWGQASHAEIMISNIQFSDFRTDGSGIANALTFDLVGTVEKNAIDQATDSFETLFVGQPENDLWFNGDEYPFKFVSGTWTYRDGTLNPTSPLVYQTPTFGDSILFTNSIAIVAGDTIDGTFSITNGSFNPALTDLSQWIVSAGNTAGSTWPDPNTATGSAVPEPNAFAIFALGGLIVATRRRRGAVLADLPSS